MVYPQVVKMAEMKVAKLVAERAVTKGERKDGRKDV